MVAGDYRSALRLATAPLHAEIDALFGAFDLGQRDGLTRFLTAQAIGMRACQPRATRFGKRSLGCSAPDYLAVLTADLVVMEADAVQLPRLELSEAIADAGVFYVLAGSRMGAAVLRDRATAPTPGGPANGVCGYFAVGEGPAMWRLFREWLTSEERASLAGTAPSPLPAILDAATATFRLFAEAAHWAAGQPVRP